MGRNTERDSKRAAEYEQYGERRQSVFCAGLNGNALAQCGMEQDQAAREAYQAERDLEAQRDMSLWALAVFIISAITAGLTLWALIYIRGTLVATREALEDTGNATNAMIRQNELTEEAQRPWVHITLKQYTPVTIEADVLTCDVLLEIGNVGASPANKVQIQDRIYPQIANVEGAGLFYAEQAEAYGGGAWGEILPPNGSVLHRVPIKVRLDEVPKLDIAGRPAISPCFVVSATYSPVGRKKIFQTGVCYFMSRVRDGNLTVFFCEPGVYGNSQVAITPHPGASIIN